MKDSKKDNYFIHKSSYVDEECHIGQGTKIWHFSHIMSKSVIGMNCNIGQNVVISPKVRLGDNVKVQNNVSIYTGVECEDNVFLGPSMVFTNVINPRSNIVRRNEFKKTIVREGASIGANATIICGVEIGKFSFVGAGAVVTKDVPDNSIYAGNPAKLVKKLDQDSFISRKDFFNDPIKLAKDFDALDRFNLKNNSIFNWVKSIVKPDNTH